MLLLHIHSELHFRQKGYYIKFQGSFHILLHRFEHLIRLSSDYRLSQFEDLKRGLKTADKFLIKDDTVAVET